MHGYDIFLIIFQFSITLHHRKITAQLPLQISERFYQAMKIGFIVGLSEAVIDFNLNWQLQF